MTPLGLSGVPWRPPLKSSSAVLIPQPLGDLPQGPFSFALRLVPPQGAWRVLEGQREAVRGSLVWGPLAMAAMRFARASLGDLAASCELHLLALLLLLLTCQWPSRLGGPCPAPSCPVPFRGWSPGTRRVSAQLPKRRVGGLAGLAGGATSCFGFLSWILEWGDAGQKTPCLGPPEGHQVAPQSLGGGWPHCGCRCMDICCLQLPSIKTPPQPSQGRTPEPGVTAVSQDCQADHCLLGAAAGGPFNLDLCRPGKARS